MTPQTLFTSWPSSSSEEYPGQSGIIAYFSIEIAITPEIRTYSGGLGVLAGTLLEQRRIWVSSCLRSRWLTERDISSSVWMRTACKARKTSRGIWSTD